MDKIAGMKALPHQKAVLEKVKDEKSRGLLLYHSLGSGKTYSAINTAKEMGLSLLAIVPAALRSNFEKEIQP